MLTVLTAFAWLIAAGLAWLLFAASQMSYDLERALAAPDEEVEPLALPVEGSERLGTTNHTNMRRAYL